VIGALAILFLASMLGPAMEPVRATHPSSDFRLSGLGVPELRPPGPSVTSAEDRLIVESRDPGIAPNQGLETNITGWSAIGLPSGTSFQTGAEEVIGRYEAVFGVFQNSQSPPTPFFSVFNNSTNANVHLLYWTQLPLSTGVSYLFALVRVTGNIWELTVNDQPFGGNRSTAEFDFGAASATWAGGVGFSEIAISDNQTPAPGELDVPLAVAVLQSGAWTLPSEGHLFVSAPGFPPWGLIGRNQLGTLAPGEIRSGTTIQREVNDTPLWTGGRIPVAVQLIPTQSTVVGTSSTIVSATVTELTAPFSPIPGVSVYFADGLGGAVLPSTSQTGPDGVASVLIESANVTVPSLDQVHATVSLFGYTGSASAQYNVTPPIHVLLSVSPTHVTVQPNDQFTVRIVSTDVGQHLVPGVGLFLSVSGPAFISPTEASTNGTGVLLARITVFAGNGPISLNATVVGGGAWGHINVSFGVSRPAPSFLQTVGPYLAPAIVAALAALLLFLLRRRMKRRKQLPDLGLRTLLRELRRANRRSGSQPPINRTPPSSGSP
jgi:hypothetical protein